MERLSDLAKTYYANFLPFDLAFTDVLSNAYRYTRGLWTTTSIQICSSLNCRRATPCACFISTPTWNDGNDNNVALTIIANVSYKLYKAYNFLNYRMKVLLNLLVNIEKYFGQTFFNRSKMPPTRSFEILEFRWTNCYQQVSLVSTTEYYCYLTWSLNSNSRTVDVLRRFTFTVHSKNMNWLIAVHEAKCLRCFSPSGWQNIIRTSKCLQIRCLGITPLCLFSNARKLEQGALHITIMKNNASYIWMPSKMDLNGSILLSARK